MSKPPKTLQLDFDELRELAQRNSAEFEQLRQHLLQEFFATSPPALQRRLRGIQWKIDVIRSKHSSPLGACLAVYQLMWDSMIQLQSLQNNIPPAVNDADVPAENSAKILPFKLRK